MPTVKTPLPTSSLEDELTSTSIDEHPRDELAQLSNLRSSTSSPLTSEPPTRSTSPDSRRGTKSRYLEDIRHEVMVNYIFQQQCSHLWLDHENPSECEGVILRKTKGTYLSCPPALMRTRLAAACVELNLQVCFTFLDPLHANCSRWQ